MRPHQAGSKMEFVRKADDRQNRFVTLLEKIPWLSTASRRKRWLVGVSGGADSVALLRLLVGAGFRKLVVCHLDHGLRGRASAGDAKFVERLAGEMGLVFEGAKADVKGRMRERGESMETAARNERHEFFAACARKHRCREILLAHHLDDQAETILWNLLRGSHGLKGMAEEKTLGRLRVTRPLLGVRRGELVEWLVAEGHRWREDASNALPVAVRNRLRNEALPLLAEISGRDATGALVRGAEQWGEMAGVLEWALGRANVIDPQGRLHVPALRELPRALQLAAVREFLIGQGIGNPESDLLGRGVELVFGGKVSVVNLPGGRRLRRREGRMWVE